MLTRLQIAALAIVMACLPATAAVYKWVDDDGEVIYSDRPMDDKATALAIKSRPTDNTRISTRKQARIEQQAQQQEEQAQAETQAQKDRDNDERADENCRRAEEALASLRNAERLYVPLEDGGRRYLSDAETQARLDRANNDVDEWCNR